MHAANYKKDIEIWTVESRQLSFRVKLYKPWERIRQTV